MIKSDSKHRWRWDWEIWFDCSELLYSHCNIILWKWRSTDLTETNCFDNASSKPSICPFSYDTSVPYHWMRRPQQDAASVLMHKKTAGRLPSQPCYFPQSPEIAQKPPLQLVIRAFYFCLRKIKARIAAGKGTMCGDKEELLPLWGLPVREIYLPPDTSPSVCHLRSIHGFIKHHSSSLSKAIKSGRWMALRP